MSTLIVLFDVGLLLHRSSQFDPGARLGTGLERLTIGSVLLPLLLLMLIAYVG